MRATPLPDGALLSRDQWRRLGVGTRRLKGQAFLRLLPGQYTPSAAPADLVAMCRALQTSLIPGAVISHSTAAALYGIPLPHDLDDGVGLLVWEPDPRTGRRRPTLAVPPAAPNAAPNSGKTTGRATPVGPVTQVPRLHCRVAPEIRARAGEHVTVHRMRPGRTRRHLGLTLSSPGEMLIELAQTLEHDEIVIALDHVLGPRGPFGVRTRSQLRDLLAPYVGRRGFTALSRAVEDAREHVESPGETRTRLLLMRAGFPEPTPNLVVEDPHTGRTRRLDLAYADLKIAIEYDGDVHRSKNAWREDQARQDSLASVGWAFRRLTMTDIRDPERLLSALRLSFLAAGAPAPPASRWTKGRARELARPRARPRATKRPTPLRASPLHMPAEDSSGATA